MKKQKLTILKIGGKLLEEDAKLEQALKAFTSLEGLKILVHGGGKAASALCRQLDIAPLVVDGRRITDAATLKVVTMQYAGWANKTIVAKLQALGCQSIGLTGADMNVIRAHKRELQPIDYGFVGDIDCINTEVIRQLLEMGVTPVFCAITHDKNGQLLNTNADTIAAKLASALAPFFETTLKLCFEKSGVLKNPADEGSVIERIRHSEFKAHQTNGLISDGMIPKLDNAFHALQQGVSEVFICGIEGIDNSKPGTQLLQ